MTHENQKSDVTGLWSYVTEREYGKLEQEVAEVRHDYRNIRMIVNENDDILHKLQKESDHKFHLLQSELKQFKVRIYTSVFVITAFASALAWLFENFPIRD